MLSLRSIRRAADMFQGGNLSGLSALRMTPTSEALFSLTHYLDQASIVTAASSG